MLTTTTPITGKAWAPFVLAQAFAPSAAIRLEEARADLARTLPAVVRDEPFRWAFGDGTATIGRTALHRYARPGQYHLVVYGYDGRARRWFAFDSVLVRVVPAGQLLQANLEYETLRIVIALVGFTWPLDGALILAVLVLLLRLQRRLPA